MTTFERFERDIPELMTELAPAQVPDYFDDMLRQTASKRQRPAWSYPERWLPMGVLARTSPMRPLPWRPILILALIGALIAAGLAFYVGSRATRLPPPFGTAGNGELLYRSMDGSIVSLHPDTAALTTLAPASLALGEPIPSRDGQRVAYVPRSDADGRIVVGRIDGSEAKPLAGEYRGIGSVSWSPDGAHIAFTSFDGQRSSLTIAATDGSSAQPLSLGVDVLQITYLPDGRLAIIAGERPGDPCPSDDPNVSPCALFIVNADGTGLDRLIAAADFHGINTIDATADGTKLLWVEWHATAEGRLHLFDLGTRIDSRLADAGFPAVYSINSAWFSPDGTSVLFDLFEADGDHWAVVPVAGGAPIRIGQEWPQNGTTAGWAPDGTSVLARYPTSPTASELWFLDATGRGADRRLDVEVPYLPSWQRVAPPAR
jgi:dipeptidyl aminopeptidase/acylaminoacyl peptidase